MRILSVDYGNRKFGLAISDDMGIVTTRLPFLDAKSEKDKLEGLVEIVRDIRPERVLFGIPSNREGKDSKQAIEIRDFIKKFDLLLEKYKQNSKIEKKPDIITWDETFSSQYAEKGRSKKFKKEDAHSEAARIFLQEYLDAPDKDNVE